MDILQAKGTNNTQFATTAFVQQGLADKVTMEATTRTSGNFDTFPTGFYRANGTFANSPIPNFNGDVRTMHYSAYSIQEAFEYSGTGGSITGIYVRDWGNRGSYSGWCSWSRLNLTPMTRAFSAPVETLFMAMNESFSTQEHIMEVVALQEQKINELEQEITNLKEGE